MRAGRVADDPALDQPKPLRIAYLLDDAGVPAVKIEEVRTFPAMESADQAGLFGEPLPPGSVVGAGYDCSDLFSSPAAVFEIFDTEVDYGILPRPP